MATVNWGDLSTDEEEFLKLCQEHDLTYMYSDDSFMYEKGNRQLRRIQAFAQHRLSKETAKVIWDSVVDDKIIPRLAKDFYWF